MNRVYWNLSLLITGLSLSACFPGSNNSNWDISKTPARFDNITAVALGSTEYKGVQNVIFDFNDDGLPDLFFVKWNEDPTRVQGFLNLGGDQFKPLQVQGLNLHYNAQFKFVRGMFGEKGIFAVVKYFGSAKEERPIEFHRVTLQEDRLVFSQMDPARFPRIVGPIGDSQLFDANQDGVLDLVVARHYSYRVGALEHEADGMSFYLGKRSSTTPSGLLFEDATEEWGLYTPPGMDPTSRQAPVPVFDLSVCDIDGDGRGDVLVAGYGRRWNKLFINRVTRFENVAESTHFDGDEDGRDDFRMNGNSFASVCADADNDGRVDVFQGEISHSWAGDTSDLSSMLWNAFPLPFERFTDFPRPPRGEFKDQSDLSANFGDIDLDGLQDLLISNGDWPPETKTVLLQQDKKRHFANATSILPEEMVSPKGAVLVDIDGDGDLDIVTGASPARGNPDDRVRVYRNRLQELGAAKDRSWVEVILRSSQPDVPEQPLGSKVKIKLPTGETLLRETTLSYGTDSQPSEMLHFGLGELPANMKTIDAQITWTNGKKTSVTLKLNELNRVTY